MAITDDAAAPLRLYFQIEPGQTADAEVIARASLAFIAGVKELAYVIDPSAVIHIGLKGHTEGSLWEDFVILVDKAKAEFEARPKRYTLALGSGLIDQSQKMTVAARATAEKKAFGHRS